MKKTKILIPILGLSSVVGVVTPLITSCNMKESENVTISFYALEGGSVSAKSIDAKVGDKWGDLKLPEATATHDYVFMGWFNGNRAMRNSDIISSDMTITARFGYNPSRVYSEEDLEKLGFSGEISDSVYKITGIPDTLTVIIPSRVYANGMQYNVGICDIDFDEDYSNVQSVYFPKTLTNMTGYSSAILTNIIVDPENPVLTSRTKAGVESNCVIQKEDESISRPAAVLLGCANSVIPTDLNIKAIARYAFYSFTSETIVLPDTLEEIGDDAFGYSNLKSITIPKKVRVIGEGAFYKNIKLEELIMLGEKPTGDHPTLLRIGQNAFNKCKLLKNVTWAKNIESIGSRAFANCELIESVSIPASTSTIASDAFINCKTLSSIVVDSANEKLKSENGNCILQNEGNDKWTLIIGCKATTIPAICTAIGKHAFDACSGLTEITIPNKVEKIDEYAFINCINLASIIIPASVSSIEKSAFNTCIKLTKVTLNDGLESIGETAFSSCNKLESITIPTTVVEMGDNAFNGCLSLKTADIKGQIIGKYAFQNCSSLDKVTFTDKLTTISDDAFENCLSLKDVKITKNITKIGQNAFRNATALTSVTFDERTEDLEISGFAFQQCLSLRNFTIPQHLTKVGQYIFDHCQIANKTIAFDGTNEECMTLITEGSWDTSWYRWTNGEVAVEKIECLKETDPNKKIIVIEDIR